MLNFKMVSAMLFLSIAGLLHAEGKNLKVCKTSSRELFPGGPVEYKITITNPKKKDINGLSFSDLAPEGITFTGISEDKPGFTSSLQLASDGSAASGGPSLLPAKSSVTVSLVETVNLSVACDACIKNTVRVLTKVQENCLCDRYCFMSDKNIDYAVNGKSAL